VDPSTVEVKQIFYASKDGTKVPMFVVHKKGLKLDGKNPTMLYGYLVWSRFVLAELEEGMDERELERAIAERVTAAKAPHEAVTV